MKSSSFAIFTAGFISGSVLLGGALVAHARLLSVNLDIGGVPPNAENSLLCTTATAAVRPVKGTSRPITVRAASGESTGVALRCPP